MNATFWKTDPVPDEGLVVSYLLPIGSISLVATSLLRMPAIRPWFDDRLIMSNHVSLLCDVGDGLVISFREEPEFGAKAVFSMRMGGEAATDEVRDLYGRVHDAFGVIMLYGRRFLKPEQF